MRSPQGEDPRFLRTAFTVQVGRGLFVAVCVVLFTVLLFEVFLLAPVGG